ncbi:hypothetical protein [Gordonia rhizosphera]|uniref:Lipoprotein n=1 Tax=Gordonia rhizosphera NBRC 16068 TaxID=1108045 RepID=K6WHE4_9ACTN|nr:hypothetical protein [Gordonia rhizosphera]GAB91577.1 hypothetical protein GORHZ_137_00170 [Gordonia rhizosphera NBRC 16068]
MIRSFRTATAVVAVLGAGLLGVTACTSESSMTTATTSQSFVNNSIEPGTLDQIAAAVAGQNLALTGRRDATGELCGSTGCSAAVAFDQLTLLKFPSTGRAQIYAGKQEQSYQVLDLVIVFPDTMSAEERTKYSEAIRIAVR